MTGPDLALAVVCGTGVGVGLWLAGSAAQPADRLHALRARRAADTTPRSRPVRAAHAAAAVAAGLGVGVVTGWPVGGLLAALAVWLLPGLVASGRAEAARTVRIEAIAGWTEMLRDTLSGAAGLEQALLATAPIAPAPIRAEVTTLAVALQSGTRLPDALDTLADDLADPTGDLVVTALQLAATRQARQLGELLGRLATAAHDHAALRLRTTAARAQTRTSVRIIIATTVVMAAGMVLLTHGYAAPYRTVAGQLVLLVVGGLFAGAYRWLGAMNRIPAPDRLLHKENQP
ncbi:type II secretion system F family protein [Frankia sp. AgB1.9]|uniref:type II secretion system F family protein n=1 Tax=unclassified Frankia TaxID=2632575 RepID=UPI0019325FA8|nr:MULTISPECIES: type II secretion system F family protein [unclassified Frankia]MBL7489717.1 type II secretion system F family protein [Frankia sp. AgW1.1]MBL7551927.1 type II secretion system F family protein [Frankia sp. AgB1.9]MBL7623234.1 type II secretion system F family protein [Frankia sp. AgB1.8]